MLNAVLDNLVEMLSCGSQNHLGECFEAINNLLISWAVKQLSIFFAHVILLDRYQNKYLFCVSIKLEVIQCMYMYLCVCALIMYMYIYSEHL